MGKAVVYMAKRQKERQREARRRKLRKLADHLTALEPGIRDSFMCPVCRDVFPLSAEKEITDAHIVPQAAGGRASTFLCKRRCNSTFGTRQDKWFGEHVRLGRQAKPSIFDTRIQPKTFSIDGVPVHGFISVDDRGTIDFRIDVHRNSPDTNRLLDAKFKSRPQRINRATVSEPSDCTAASVLASSPRIGRHGGGTRRRRDAPALLESARLPPVRRPV